VALVRRARDAGDEFFPGFVDVTEIGVGRLATVFAARELATERVVALKLLSARNASPAAVESFARESAALGVLGSHPNVVTLFSSFAAVDDRPVLALELCRDQVAGRDRRLAVADAVDVAARIAGALEAVHAVGIVHCDVKPANILRSDYAEPTLADFGAALLPGHSSTGLVDLTTPHVAPELLGGGTAGPATDVYGLASTLYELIAGRPAFGGAGDRPMPFVSRIHDGGVAPLVNPGVPPALSALIVQAMSKDAGDRPSTAEFAAALASLVIRRD
jgi:serine/threonine protein kinase